MVSLSIMEFKRYCDSKKLVNFTFDSLNQNEDGYALANIKMKHLRMFVMPADGIIIFNDSDKKSAITFRYVKSVVVRKVQPYFGITFDIVCGKNDEITYSMVGRFSYPKEEI